MQRRPSPTVSTILALFERWPVVGCRPTKNFLSTQLSPHRNRWTTAESHQYRFARMIANSQEGPDSDRHTRKRAHDRRWQECRAGDRYSDRISSKCHHFSFNINARRQTCLNICCRASRDQNIFRQKIGSDINATGPIKREIAPALKIKSDKITFIIDH